MSQPYQNSSPNENIGETSQKHSSKETPTASDASSSQLPQMQKTDENLQSQIKIPTIGEQAKSTQISFDGDSSVVSSASQKSSHQLSIQSSSSYRRNRADRAKSGMLPVSHRRSHGTNSRGQLIQPAPMVNPVEAMVRSSVFKRQAIPCTISLSMLRVRPSQQVSSSSSQQNAAMQQLIIDEDEMKLKGASSDRNIRATRTVSNEAWFDKFAFDKTISKALRNSYNLCFMIYGQKGSGKDYCITGGVVQQQNVQQQRPSSTSLGENLLGNEQQYLMMIDQLAHKHREPGLIRLAYEAVIAQICVNKNAQYTIQLTCGMICNEELEDLLLDDQATAGGNGLDDTQPYQRSTRQTHLPGSSTDQLTRRHCNGIKQLSQLLQQIQFRREQIQAKNETLIYELIIERFSLDPADYDTRTTLSKLCFLRLPHSELLNIDQADMQANANNAFRQSLLRVQALSLKSFYQHVLNQKMAQPYQAENQNGQQQYPQRNSTDGETALNSKLIQFLINEAYYDFKEESNTQADEYPQVIEPISDLCFICCLLENHNSSNN